MSPFTQILATRPELQNRLVKGASLLSSEILHLLLLRLIYVLLRIVTVFAFDNEDHPRHEVIHSDILNITGV